MSVLSKVATFEPIKAGRMIRRAMVLVLSITAIPFLAVGSLQAVELPTNAAPLSAVELLQIYGGKTWKWSAGGAFFDKDGRKFRARTVNETGENNVTGIWRITDTGKFCFKAKWAENAATADTCFEHRASNGDIYQRRLPDGSWYIFKHAKTEPNDQYNKLVRGDLVSRAETTD